MLSECIRGLPLEIKSIIIRSTTTKSDSEVLEECLITTCLGIMEIICSTIE